MYSDAPEYLKPVHIDAFDVDDAWFQALDKILERGTVYKIDRGSYEGQHRLEFDFVTIRIREPGKQPIPIIPEGCGVPAPTSKEYIDQYLGYLLTGDVTDTEDYTYGNRIVDPKLKIRGADGTQEICLGVNQLQEVIKMYKTTGHGTNQAIMEIGCPSDIKLVDPPCMRLIDTRIRYGKLHFFLYFRSWDLWGGFPSNVGGLQRVKEWMAEEIGVADGEMVCISKGMHLYEYCWEWAKTRTKKFDLVIK